MRLIENKEPLDPGYKWISRIKLPYKLLPGEDRFSPIICAVAGTVPLLIPGGHSIWGSLPGKPGVFTFYTYSEGIEAAAESTPGIYYYWDRSPTVKQLSEKFDQNLPRVSETTRGAKPLDEPWHWWDDETMFAHIRKVCSLVVEQNVSELEACSMAGITHWGFNALFQYKWPVKYHEWKTSSTIPEKDQQTKPETSGMAAMSCS